MASPSFAARWLPIIFWMGVIFLASTDLGSAAHTGSIVLSMLHLLFGGHLSLPAMEEIHHFIRKGAHLTEYAILGVLLRRAFSAQPAAETRTSAFFRNWSTVAALVVAFLYASSDEYHQSYVPSRTSSPYDVMIDTAGAALGLVLCTVFHRARRSGASPRDPGTT